MVTAQASGIRRYLRRMMLAQEPETMTDAALVEHFLASGDEMAFEILVRRHGPMVRGVCRRVLRREHEAEDAFQATFLILLKKMSSISRPKLLANWLYGVAFRTAMEARHRLLRRQGREHAAAGDFEDRPDTEPWSDLRPVLDEELRRLPEKFRIPVVLCDLQSKSREEAARQIGCPEGTLSSRLARARDLLRERLVRRGLTLSIAGTLLPAGEACAAVPSSLLTATVESALSAATEPAAVVSAQVTALAEGVLNIMFLTKLKIAALVVVSLALIAGSGGYAHHVLTTPAAAGSEFLAKNPNDDAQADRNDPPRDAPRKDAPRTGDPPRAGPTVTGFIKSVDPATRNVTVTVRTEGEEASDHTVKLGPDVKIATAANSAGTIDDLKPRMRVVITLTADQKAVVAIREAPGDDPGRRPEQGKDGEKRAVVFGLAKATDPAKNTITITILRDGGGGEDRTYELAKDARIVVPRNENAKLGDVAAGMRCWLTLRPDRALVTLVQAGFPRRPTEDEDERPGGENARREKRLPTLNGTLKSVDASKNSLTVTLRDEAGDYERTLEVSKDVRVVVGRREGATMADVKAGMRVQLTLSNDRKVIIQIREFQGEDREEG